MGLFKKKTKEEKQDKEKAKIISKVSGALENGDYSLRKESFYSVDDISGLKKYKGKDLYIMTNSAGVPIKIVEGEEGINEARIEYNITRDRQEQIDIEKEAKEQEKKRKREKRVEATVLAKDPEAFSESLSKSRDDYMKQLDDFRKLLADDGGDDVNEDLSLNANDLADYKDDSPAMKNKKAKARFMLNKLNKAKHNLFEKSAINYQLTGDDTEYKLSLDMLPKKQEAVAAYQEKRAIEKEGAETKYVDPTSGIEKTGVNLMGQKVVQSLDNPERTLELLKLKSAKDPLKDYKNKSDEELIKLLSK